MSAEKHTKVCKSQFSFSQKSLNQLIKNFLLQTEQSHSEPNEETLQRNCQNEARN